jgi:ribosomal protein S12 methylthiotransferase accessory factor
MIQTYSSIEKISECVEFLIDDHVGVIAYVKELPRESGSPNFFHFYSKAANTASFSKQCNFSRGGGASTIRSCAIAKAIGEAIERYCSAIFYQEEFPLTTFQNAGFSCIPPSTFALYSPSQYQQLNFPYAMFDTHTPVRWVPGHNLCTNEMVYLPAMMVFLPYEADDQEVLITQRISTGLACHCTLEEASISAICEVIERDAFSITWQTGLVRPKIKIESLDPLNRDLISRFEATGCSVTLVNITLDTGIPTSLAILHGKCPDSPALVFAAATDLNPAGAVRKSLEELAHTWRLAFRLKNHSPPFSPGIAFENVENQEDHVHLYCDHNNLQLAEFIYSAQEYIDLQELPNLSTQNPTLDLNTLVNHIDRVNHQVIIVELSTPDIKGLGLNVVRAVIPGFHPLFIGHRFRALGGTRLWNVPKTMGIFETRENFSPHPFP